MIVKKGNMSELYASLVEDSKKAEIGEDEFTVYDFANDIGVGRAQAANKLKKLAKEGRVKERDAIRDGRAIKAYKVVK